MKKLIKSIVVFIVFYLSVYLQYIPFYLLHMDKNNVTDKDAVILTSFSTICLTIFLIIVYRKELIKEFKKFKSNIKESVDIGFKYWLTGLIIMVVSNLIITNVFHAGGANNEQGIQKMLHAYPFLMIISAGIIGPFNEEIVFRKTIKDVIKNKWIFAGLAFIIFGLAHVISSAENYLDYLYVVPYGVLGACFALTYYDTDSIYTSMFYHMFHNITLILMSIYIY